MTNQTNSVQKIFADAFILTNRVRIYVPSTSVGFETFDNSENIAVIRQKLSELNGGCTSYHATGSWNSDQFGLINEDVEIVESFCPELTDALLWEVKKLALWIKNVQKQEGVSVQINETLIIV